MLSLPNRYLSLSCVADPPNVQEKQVELFSTDFVPAKVREQGNAKINTWARNPSGCLVRSTECVRQRLAFSPPKLSEA